MSVFYLIETLLSPVLCRGLYHALFLLLLLGTSQFIHCLPARLVIILVVFVHNYTFLHIHYHRPYHSVCPPQYQFHLPPVGYPPCLIQILSVCFQVIKPITPSNTISQHSPLHTRFISFVQHDNTLLLDITNTIVDLTFPVPKPPLISDNNVFDAWFGIIYPDSHHTTHVRFPHPSEIFHLYSLQTLTLLYSSLLSSFTIKYLVLHTLPPCLSRHVANVLPSTILTPPIPPPVTHQSISSCFTL